MPLRRSETWFQNDEGIAAAIVAIRELEKQLAAMIDLKDALDEAKGLLAQIQPKYRSPQIDAFLAAQGGKK